MTEYEMQERIEHLEAALDRIANGCMQLLMAHVALSQSASRTSAELGRVTMALELAGIKTDIMGE